jgi:hypothetical protein
MADTAIHITLQTEGMQEVNLRIPVDPPIAQLAEDDRTAMLIELGKMVAQSIELLAKSKPWMHQEGWETREVAA